jgi:Fur family ferric uptake transcriptional regulator
MGRVKLSDADVQQAVNTFEEFLRRKRLKMTEQRRQMVRAALEKRGHFTAEELYRKLGGSGDPVSMATVYRGLALLEEAELIEGHDFADGQRRYERALDREHHDHMICVDCRAVVEFTNDRIERLQEQAAADHGFSIKDHSLTLFVECKEWSEKGNCARRERKLAQQKTAEA